MLRRIALLGTLAVLALPSAANAAFPGENGKIAFVRGGEVLTVNPDGTGQGQVTSDGHSKGQLQWSADGHRIAFVQSDSPGSSSLWTMDEAGGSRVHVINGFVVGLSWSPTGTALTYGESSGTYPYPGHVIRINADGTGYTDLTDDPDDPFDGGDYPSWSPDGFRIAYEGLTTYADNEGDPFPGSNGIWSTTPAGGFGTQLKGASDHEFYREPDWSPSGAKIVFSGTADPSCTAPSCANMDLYVMNADGTGLTKITSGVANDLDPAWSPDGTKIVFASAVAPPDPATCGANDCNYELFTINPDGSGLTRITDNSVPDRWPTWQPIRGPYPRPRGATPMRLSLVPAYSSCTAPNRSHGAPLSYPSCAPPALAGSNLTIGIGDGTPPQAKSLGSLRMIVQGSPPSDVGLILSITNVYRRADLTDYAGELEGRLSVRLTDRQSSGPATAQDFPFSFAAPCTTTADTTLGSSCAVNTTANTVLPGAIASGDRAIWGLDQVRVYDGGADGDADTTADNQLFEVQGLFAP